MLPEYFAFVSTIIASLGGIQYLWLTFHGKVQPNRMTYFFWGLFPLIVFFAQTTIEISSVVWITLAMGIVPFLILITSFLNPAAYWKIKKRDYILAVIAVISMVLWYVTNNPVLAIFFALSADILASLPTILKCYTDPFSEDWRPYAINSVGFFIGVLSIQTWSFAEYSFILYLFLGTLMMSGLIYIRQKQKPITADKADINNKALLIPFNSNQEIFLQDRAGHKPPPWGFFGGDTEEGETPLQSVIRETKEELDLDIAGEDLISMGRFQYPFGGEDVERNFFLYKTEQESFTVLEGRGGQWMDKATAERHLDIDERFDKIWQLIQENI